MKTPAGGALVGRASELERLSACARRLTDGAGGIVLLEGDAGTGKTRLLSEFTSALPRGCIAAIAAALDYAPSPYAPIRELLLALDRSLPQVMQDRAISAGVRAIVDYSAAQSVTRDDPRRVLDGAVTAFARYASAAPIVLAVEDAHWIDRATADVVVHLSRAIESMRALLIVTFRPGDVEQNEHVRYLAGRLGRGAAVSISLGPLSASDALLLVDDVAPNLSAEARRNVCRIAEGNPLLLVEFAKMSAENAGSVQRSFPLSLKSLVAERLAGYDDVDLDVLRVAAAMSEFEPRVLAEIVGVPAQRVAATLRKARDASIVAERTPAATPFVFRHALIRHAVTDDLLAYEIQELHRRIAERLAREPDRADLHPRLAHHYWQAGETDAARRYAEIAAREAMDVFAYADAVRLYERAIDGRPIAAPTFDLYRRYADACSGAHQAGDAERITASLLAYAREQCAPNVAAAMAFELSRRRRDVLDDEGAMAAIREGLACVDEAADPQLAFDLYATHAWYLTHLRRTAEGAEALARARELIGHGTPQALMRYHEAAAALDVHAGDGAHYRNDVERALELARGAGIPMLIKRLENGISLALASTLDGMDYALELCERLRAASAGVPDQVTAPAFCIAAWVYYLSGDLRASHEALGRTFAAAEETPLLSFNVAKTGIPLGLHVGDAVLVRRCARPRLLESAFASQTPLVFGPVAAAVSEQLRSQKRDSEALALVRQALKRISSAANNVPLAIEAARLGDEETAARAISLLAELEGRSPSGSGASELARAYAARGNERRERAAAAAEAFERAGWRIYRAQALELAGEEPAALELYAACGADADVRRLEGTRGARARTGLSKREWEVAALVARGHSNRSIAGDLSLSERTVENHVASIFAKLDLRSRAEIAAYVARADALGE